MFFCTISSNRMPCRYDDEPWRVWDCINEAFKDAVKGGVFRGALTVEELAPSNYLDGTAVMHLHTLVHSRDMSCLGTVVEDANLRLAEYYGESVKVHSFTPPIRREADLYNIVHYIVKPTDWATAYAEQWPSAPDKKKFNSRVRQMIRHWEEMMVSRTGIVSRGSLFAGSKNRAVVPVKERMTGSNLAALSRFMDTAMEDGFDGLAEPIEQ
jgi:hypothetical protein